jgi:CRISPR-associated protein Cmr2
VDNGIGKFHDRFILQSGTLTLEKVRAVVDEVRDALADRIADATNLEPSKVRAELQAYLQCYLLETDGAPKNPILDISGYLDSIELHTPPLPHGDSVLRKFLQRDTIVNSELAKESFGKTPSFKSIPAISAQEEGHDDVDKKEHFKNAYRYIAIVHADGDNLGSVIRQGDPKAFSKALFDFGAAAVRSLGDYGAQTLFVGGDDLLFFAPVLHKDGRTIFELIDTLSTDYAAALGTEETTLSFGVSVTYFKYPLYEALERSRNALFGTAKRFEGKNAVAVTVQKHSGQSFAFCVGKREEGYGAFKTLLQDVLLEHAAIPHSLHHKLSLLEGVWRDADTTRIDNLFSNFFNEDVHQNDFKAGLEGTRALMHALGTSMKAQERLFSMLSLIKLLRGDR